MRWILGADCTNCGQVSNVGGCGVHSPVHQTRPEPVAALPHRVWHLALEKLLGVEAEALARARAARTARSLRRLHPAQLNRSGGQGLLKLRQQRSRNACVRHPHPAGVGDREVTGRAPGGTPLARRGIISATTCACAHSPGCTIMCKLTPPADGRDPQAVHPGARVVLLLLHHPAVHHVNHAVHCAAAYGGEAWRGAA